jgi:hypothetical protein
MKYYLTIDVDEMGAFCSLNEIDFHFKDFIQLRLAGWEVIISNENGWGFYELEITEDCLILGDLVIWEEADIMLNGVRFTISKLD